MIELDDVWEQMLAESGSSSIVKDRSVLVDFIALKAANDQIRQRAVDWLIAAFSELAAHIDRRNITVEVERTETNSFAAYGANMVGPKVNFRHGLRCLTVKAGWTRVPSDGFMRGGALAVAQIRHFGLNRYGADLALLKNGDLPEWHEIDQDNIARPIRFQDLARHLTVLIDRE